MEKPLLTPKCQKVVGFAATRKPRRYSKTSSPKGPINRKAKHEKSPETEKLRKDHINLNKHQRKYQNSPTKNCKLAKKNKTPQQRTENHQKNNTSLRIASSASTKCSKRFFAVFCSTSFPSSIQAKTAAEEGAL